MRKRPNLPFETRSAAILGYLDQHSSISVDTVVNLCNVCHSTARTQLGIMAEKGLLIRTHGGALRDVSKNISSNNPDNIVHYAEKMRIATIAAEKIVPGDIVAIGGGTTNLCLAKALLSARDIVVVTNSINIASVLKANRNIELHLSGGVLRSENGACTGSRAESFFENISATKSFIGVDSVDPTFGFTVFNPDERTEHAILCCASTRYVLFDHSKFSRSPYVDKLASFSDIHVCITNKEANPTDIQYLKNSGITVILA